MARTPTIEIPLGYKAPYFELPDVVTGKLENIDSLKGEKATIVVFMCNHCPFVIHVLDQIISLAHDYKSKGVNLIAISSNDVLNYPQDGPDKMADLASQKSFPFPYLYDETQEVAKAYTAACTPDFSIFNEQNICVYRGQLDASRPGNSKPNDGSDMRKALDEILAGQPISFTQIPSIGCNIKWKG